MRDPFVQCFGINTLSILHVSPFLLPMHVLCHVLVLFSGEREGAAPQTISVLISF